MLSRKKWYSNQYLCYKNLAEYLTRDEQQLRGGIRFLDLIPRNPAGKILRQDLINMI